MEIRLGPGSLWISAEPSTGRTSNLHLWFLGRYLSRLLLKNPVLFFNSV